ncbi:hypothetical protein B0H16DRAFT_205461 [Mycena metata]|uniref:Secreted protein n=1 Tax=Mycena metata TaxID=1033252 RepID=A0AAD7MSI2_9AGAR|nr:hypothetical protein B0H16DRAFT_205461 [Mycena metata]
MPSRSSRCMCIVLGSAVSVIWGHRSWGRLGGEASFSFLRSAGGVDRRRSAFVPLQVWMTNANANADESVGGWRGGGEEAVLPLLCFAGGGDAQSQGTGCGTSSRLKSGAVRRAVSILGPTHPHPGSQVLSPLRAVECARALHQGALPTIPSFQGRGRSTTGSCKGHGRDRGSIRLYTPSSAHCSLLRGALPTILSSQGRESFRGLV